MGWVRVSDDFYDHPKFVAAGPLGVALWLTGMAYCNRNLTDGYIPKSRARGLLDFDGLSYTVATFAGGAVGEDDCWPLASNSLVGVDLWHEDGHTCPRCPQPGPGYYYVHDYLLFQPSREQVEELREKRADAGRKGGQAKAQHAAKQPAKQVARQGAKQEGKQTGGKNVPPIPNPSPVTTSRDPSSPIGGAGENEDGLEARSKRFGFDGQRIRRELTKLLDEFPDDDSVMRVATTILKKAAGWPNDPTGYVITSIKNDVFTAKRLAYGGAA